MENQTGTISISRKKSMANTLRQFAISLDDNTIGKIKSGQTKQFQVPSGAHTVRVKMAPYNSQQLLIDLKPDETLNLECGEHGSATLGEAFSIKGLENSLNSILKPRQYLYICLRERQSEPDVDVGHATVATTPKPATQKQYIFVSYRRDDSREITGRICDRLIGKFGNETVFRDVDSIPAGVDFREHISKTIGSCSVVVAIIGNQWLQVRNQDGKPRLGLDDDPLSVEIETALSREIPIIPVLVKGAVMPDPNELPEKLKPLAYHNAVIIPREPYFHAGVDRLIRELEGSGSTSGTDKPTTSHVYCRECGAKVITSNRFCIQCGKPV